MNYIGLKTLVVKEIKRSMRTPMQTVGAPVITTLLYFMIFGQAIGSRVGDINGLPYAQFMMPGLVLMNVITTAFQGAAFGIMFQRVVGRTINDILLSPLSHLEIALGYTAGSVLRSLLVGLLIYLTSLFFIPASIYSPLFVVVFATLVAIAFSLLGFIVGLWAANFEQLSIFPTFFIMPLSFLGGIFYSVDMLPPIAKTLSHYNPVFYIINGLRYGFLGQADVTPITAWTVLIVFLLLLLGLAWQLLRTGYNLRN